MKEQEEKKMERKNVPMEKAMPKEMRQAMRLAMYANRINDIQQKNVEKKEAVQG